MDDELKPCPFCGSDAAFGVVTEGGEANPDFGGHFVQCENTKCHGCMGLRFACGDDPRPALADAWNSRADTPIIEAQREDAARRALEAAAAIVERRSTELMARAVDAPRTASTIRAIDPAQFREAGNG